MLIYIPFEAVEPKHLEWLAASMLSAPESQRPDAESFSRAIFLGTMRLFAWDTGCVLVGQTDKRLILYALGCDKLAGVSKPLTEDLRRLAAEWQCDTIETTCFEPRFASVIQKLGGRVESQTLTLAVE